MKYKKSLSMESAIIGGIMMAIMILVLIAIIPRLIGKSGAEASDLLTSTKGCIEAGGRCVAAGQECLSTEIEKTYSICPQDTQKCCIKIPETKK